MSGLAPVTNGVQIDQSEPKTTNAVHISSIGAGKLQYGKQVREKVTCTSGDTDYASGVIPVNTEYILVWADALFVVAVEEQTSDTVGLAVAANQPAIFPVVFGVNDSRVHVQSPTPGTDVWIAYLED